MKKITSIKKTGNNKYTLLIDEEKHIIYGDVLLECNIFKPMTIDSDTFIKLINLNNYYEAYHKIYSFINYKKRTEKEIRDKLIKSRVSKENIEKIINKLYENRLLNNDDYIQSYINDQLNLTLNGPLKIRHSLEKLGFKDIEYIKYLNLENNIWHDRINRIINKKLKAKREMSSKLFIKKLANDLYNLGYEEKDYGELIQKLDIDESDALKKNYLKYRTKLSKKYSDDKLDYMVKQKLRSLGFDISDI